MSADGTTSADFLIKQSWNEGETIRTLYGTILAVEGPKMVTFKGGKDLVTNVLVSADTETVQLIGWGGIDGGKSGGNAVRLAGLTEQQVIFLNCIFLENSRYLIIIIFFDRF